MENFKCYEIHRANMPQYGCTIQCDDCLRKEILTKVDNSPEDSLTMGQIIPKEETLEEAAQKYCVKEHVGFELKMSFIAGAKWQADRMYTQEDMLFFAGYLKGCKTRDPNKDVGEIFEEWERNLKHISHG